MTRRHIHRSLVSLSTRIFPWLKVTKLLKVGCLRYAVGRQPSTPLINLGRTWTLIDDDDDDDDEGLNV